MHTTDFKITKAFSFCQAMLFVLIFSSASAQSSNNQMVAREHILAMKDGALLVRLQTRSQSIETLKDRGMEDKAKQLEERQRNQNLEYVEAFISEFDFAPVYFFRSEDSKLVKEGRLDEVVFLDGEMNADSSIKVMKKIIYTAEFGTVDPDDSKRREDYRLEKDSSGVKQKPTYYGSADMGFEALVIMNDQFVQLRRPFPYYVRTFGKKGIINRSPKKTVRKMNEKLFQFY